MDLERVRQLKAEIRDKMFVRMFRELFHPPPFAYGIGLTETPGNYRLAIDVTDEDAAEWFLKKYASVIGKNIGEVDIRITGQPRIIPPSPAEPPVLHAQSTVPLAIGARVRHSHRNGANGTLGFFARRRGVNGLVSCNHVIALIDGARAGDFIEGPSGRIGKLQRFTRLRRGKKEIVPADCAFASIEDAHWPTAPGSLGKHGELTATPAVLTQQTPVFKLGQRTNHTLGIVVKIEMDGFRFNYGRFFANFNNVIEIRSAEPPRTFGDFGDSGSLVITVDEKRPVGLLFAERHSTGVELHYANPIADVLSALEAELIVA